jgi:hypothetical protein
MANEALFATAGLMGLFIAMLTGALWDSALVAACARVLANANTYGRHAMR